MMGAIKNGAAGSTNSGAALRLFAVALSLLAAVSLQAQAAPGQVTTPMPTAPSASAPPLPTAPDAPKRSIAGTDAVPTVITPPKLPGMAEVPGAEVDRVVAVVNGDLILDSDVDQERRFAALLPYGEASGNYTRERAVERLINRDLILQQVKLQPQEPITAEDAAKDLEALRKALPNCKQYRCETKEGWDKYIATQGFTEQSLDELWRQRMVVLQFIEQRFRMGIKIMPKEIDSYYTNTLLPQYAAQHATPPPVAAISTRIQEILLQQRVSVLLEDWLQSLRAQGNVVLLHPGEDAP